jgi:DNA-directed RNA polymerase subunit RPC12/RpoP
MSLQICSNCGSEYILSSNPISMRDKDTIDCEVCGNEIFRWNEAKIWFAKLKTKKENHLR